MFDVIVVGTDGSETASVALAKAIELAGHEGATLHVVHAHRLVSAAQLGQAASVGAPTFDIAQVNRGIEDDSRQVCRARRCAGQGRGREGGDPPGAGRRGRTRCSTSPNRSGRTSWSSATAG